MIRLRDDAAFAVVPEDLVPWTAPKAPCADDTIVIDLNDIELEEQDQ